MSLTDAALWNRLMAFHYETPAAGGLVEQVTQALGLTKREAHSRVEAYLRFIYLVAVSDEVLAPSKPVDEVWHLHLEDVARYEGAFCLLLLGRVINHHEGRPAPAKDPAYRRTLARYRAEFGGKPPTALWPAPARPSGKPVALMVGGVACLAGSVLAAAPILALLGLLLLVVGFVLLLDGFGAKNGKDSSGCGGSGCGGRATCASNHSGGDSGGDSDGGGCGGD
ncbi:hypothetical protein EGN72_16495 [Pseudorhodobacter sp. E13]|uniref:glycine-rich domain-containing protein n=1 Tax=Pseudorhodobacter sp. E13 TaxID=2487931 RepID=UPI000F8CD897|nr:hypothetical protein [Pseudorhodobacter sp. E13]RUS58540.1 hypothetical protein EGN72_16495 [Pseudorhodobacter sp. E13]